MNQTKGRKDKKARRPGRPKKHESPPALRGVRTGEVPGREPLPANLRTHAAQRGQISYAQSAQVVHLLNPRGNELAQMIVPRVFMRSCRLPPAAFRVLCHGLTYAKGWSVQKCCIDLNMQQRGVRAILSKLMVMGYVVVRKNPMDRRKTVYRFYPFPQEVIREYEVLDEFLQGEAEEQSLMDAVDDENNEDNEDAEE